MAFRHMADVARETEEYLDKRRKGLITSCRTGYKRLDETLLDGIEFGSVLSIGGRPSSGKTAFSSALIRGILDSNDTKNIEILDFNWEMSGRSLLIRDLSAEVRRTYKDIISAGDHMVTNEEMENYKKVLKKYAAHPWFLEEEPKSAKEFESVIEKRMEVNPNKKRIIRIDHSILAKQAASEPTQVIMLQNLLKACVRLKKMGDNIFIVLTQLVRDFEDRQENGSEGAFPKQSDCFGGDAVAQSSEVLMLLNRPAAYGIELYGRRGKDAVHVEKDHLFAHVVKSRNAEPDLILSYKAVFSEMRIVEL